MTFSDIFKSSFLENVTSVSILDMALALGLSFAIGLFIFLIYRKTYAGVMYSASFGVTLVGLTMISTFVILAVTSNVVLSLGMVGALSIVRFRTAIKEPLDIAFLFWAIAESYAKQRQFITDAGHEMKTPLTIIAANATGTDIDPDQLPRLFDRFYRTDASRNSETGGYGIGLSVAKAIVTAHGGSIRAISDGPRTFRIRASLPS